MKKHKIGKTLCYFLIGLLCCGAMVTIAVRELQKAPVDGVLYFDTEHDLMQSRAYQLDLDGNRLTEVQVEGYAHISNVTPAEDGFYCMGIKDANNQMYILFCEEGKAKKELSAEHLVQHTSQRWISFVTLYRDGAVFRLPGNGADLPLLYYADFSAETVEPLRGTENCGAFAQVQDDTVYFSKRDGKVYRRKGKQAEFLFNGSNPVFLNGNTLLYSNASAGSDEPGGFTFDLGSGQSVPSELHYDILKYHSGVEFDGGRCVVGDWLVGYEPGLLRERHINSTGKVTFTNLKTGKRIVLAKLSWRNSEHLTYSKYKVI